LEQSNQILLQRFMKYEDRLFATENKLAVTENSISGIVKLFWAAITTGVTAIISAYFIQRG